MCGHVVQASGPDQLGLKIVNAFEGPDNRTPSNFPPRYNAAPSQELWVIRQHPDTGVRSLDMLRWVLIPYWSKQRPKPPPINAKAETVAKLPMFRDAYGRRRCIMPIDAFFEWKAISARAKFLNSARCSGPRHFNGLGCADYRCEKMA